MANRSDGIDTCEMDPLLPDGDIGQNAMGEPCILPNGGQTDLVNMMKTFMTAMTSTVKSTMQSVLDSALKAMTHQADRGEKRSINHSVRSPSYTRQDDKSRGANLARVYNAESPQDRVYSDHGRNSHRLSPKNTLGIPTREITPPRSDRKLKRRCLKLTRREATRSEDKSTDDSDSDVSTVSTNKLFKSRARESSKLPVFTGKENWADGT
jgi:hypothetical protein